MTGWEVWEEVDRSIHYKSKEVMSGSERNIYYFEWYIKSGGVYNDVTIGVESEMEQITYSGVTGEIMKNGTKVARGPVFGSYNVIGVGVSFKHGYVFFTYHGIPIFPAVKAEP